MSTVTRRRLPPFGREYLIRRQAPGYLNQGPRVAIGARAWELAREAVAIPIMVLPPDEEPASFAWPVGGEAVLLFETGDPDDEALERLAQALLADGAALVHAIRRCDLPGNPPGSPGRAGPAWVRA
ncbi:MAG: hypothetical protein JNK40_15770 [Chromatiales bacterium]|nr:hypothetical protein [Chromatiales bacterium]